MDYELTLSPAALSLFLFLSSIYTAKFSYFEAPIPLERGKEFTAWQGHGYVNTAWAGEVSCSALYNTCLRSTLPAG